MSNYTKKDQISLTMHAWKLDHKINFHDEWTRHRQDDKGNYRLRKTLESWQPQTIPADNNSKPLPEQYTVLLQK